jgi:hypothetical protein
LWWWPTTGGALFVKKNFEKQFKKTTGQYNVFVFAPQFALIHWFLDDIPEHKFLLTFC